jgi:hypothetical protein
LPLEAAAKQVNRSVPTIKRLVARGLVAKRLVPVPGKRAQAQVSMADLEVALGQPVYVLPRAGSQSDPMIQKPVQTDPIALVPAQNASLPAALERIAEALANSPLATRHSAAVELRDKLCWTMKEARRMTGLTDKALWELVQAHPELAIIRVNGAGQRIWIKAGKLRGILG